MLPAANGREASLRNPTSLEEVEQLVKSLYLPGSPKHVSQTQEILLQLQRSSDGWQLGNHLLTSDDQNVRFFGALTFTIKLNSDWHTLDDQSAEDLLMRLINWLIRLIAQNEGSLVLRKLCSTLVIYFLRFPSMWSDCVRHLLFSFSAGKALPVAALDQSSPVTDVVRALSDSQVITSLWFCSALVEVVGKTDANSIRNQLLHERVKVNVDDAAALISHELSSFAAARSAARPDSSRALEALKCFQSWVFYSHKAFVDCALEMDGLKTINAAVTQFLVFEETFEQAAEFFTDVLTNYPTYLRQADFQKLFSLICSNWAEEKLRGLREGDADDELIQFGRLLLAFGDATVQDVARTPDSFTSQQFMRMMHGLLTCKGYAVLDDEICAQALEFWSTFVEFMIDSLFAEREKDAAWIGPARGHLIQAIEELWMKIQLPPLEVFVHWDSDTRAEFKDFRKDVSDLLQASYPILGLEVFRKLTDLALLSINHTTWRETEATLYCLIALADSLAEDDESDGVLAQLFGSPMLPSLADVTLDIPGKTRHTAVNLLGHFASFFERHTEYLPSALNFLFQTIDFPTQAPIASKSIHSLCFSCRKSLTAELPIFLQQYERFQQSPSVESFTKERVMGAIAAIIQALSTDLEKVAPLGRLLTFIEQDVQRAADATVNTRLDDANELALGALQCLASIGKGMQEPDDVPIDLESDRPVRNFWDHAQGASVQQRIMHTIETIFDAFCQNGDIVEAACAVLRTGFSETLPGPFVFTPDMTACFLLKSTPRTPRLGVVIATACSLVSSRSTSLSTKIDREAEIIAYHILSFVREPGGSGDDPEIAQNCIDFMSRMLPRYVNVMLGIEPKSLLEDFFMYTLHCMTGQDVLPKRSAASFWSAILVLQNQSHNQQESLNSIVEHLGPLLAEALVLNFGGNAARSELDSLSDPLKKMVSRQLRSKAWLEAALFNENFPSHRVGASEKKAFLQKVASLRGAKGTNQVVKDFWLACRGMSSADAS